MTENSSTLAPTGTGLAPTGTGPNGWALDHIGHAVNDLEAAIATYTERAGFSLIEREELPEHRVRAAFLRGPGATNQAPLIELIQPLAGNATLARFLDRRGEGLHHLCYSVASVSQELARLHALGVSLIDAVPRTGSRGMDVAFLHPKSFHGVMIELCSPRR